jgi:predicted kinase
MQQINQELADAYLATLDCRAIPHRRVYMIFSGVPGSGKTTLGKKLARDMQSVYIRHDDIRQIARERGYDVQKLTISSISRIVIDTILENDANGLILLDASLDRTWPMFFDHAKQQQAQPIVIRLNVPRKVIEARIVARPAYDFGKVDDIDVFFEQFEACKKEVKATIELGEHYDYDDVLQRLRELTK